VIELLHRRGASVTYSDPFVPVLQHGDVDLKAVPEDTDGSGIDCAVICTNHRVFNYPGIVSRYPLIVDTRNALKGIQANHIFRL
jgi:UDP-N-acetyl-D-glucosamine dehydrogenase